MTKDTRYLKLQYISKLAVYFYAAGTYSERFQTSKADILVKKVKGFQLLTSLAKSFTSDVLQGSKYVSFQLTIDINKSYMTKTNHRTTLRQTK